MGFVDALKKLGSRVKERREMARQADEQFRIHKMVEDRQKSSNERELERFQNEEREEQIHEALDYYRKKKDMDIKFNHNPLNVQNITNHTDWEVLKERNQFAGNGCMFSNQEFIHKNNPNLFRNNRSLFTI